MAARLVCMLCTVLLAVLPSACSLIDTAPGRLVRFEDARLDGVVAAFALNPQLSDSWRVRTGYVALVKDDESAEWIRTSGMTTGRLAWTRRGLFFTDRDREYLIGSDGINRRRDLHAPDALMEHMIVDGSGRVLAVYDLGANQDHPYLMELREVMPVKESAAIGTVVESTPFHYGVSICGENIIGIGHDTNEMRLWAEPIIGSGSHRSLPLESEEGELSGISMTSSPDCIGQRIIRLVGRSRRPAPGQGEGSGSWADAFELLSWNMGDGSHTFTPLTRGAAPWIENVESVSLATVPGSLREGTLTSIDTLNGDLYRTDMRTGNTAMIYTNTHRWDHADRVPRHFMNLDEHTITLLDIPQSGDAEPHATLTYLDRRTMRVVRSIALDPSVRAYWREHHLFDTGFVTPPRQMPAQSRTS